MNRRVFLSGFAAVVASPAVLATVGCPAKNWQDNAEADAQTASIILLSILGVVGVAEANSQIPAATAAKIRQAVQIAQTTLNELLASIQAYKASPSDTTLGKIGDTLNTLASQLPGVLEGLLIENSQARTAITAGLSLLISIIAALQVIVPALHSNRALVWSSPVGNAKPAIRSGEVVLPSRAAIVSMYNSVLVQNGYPGQQVQ